MNRAEFYEFLKNKWSLELKWSPQQKKENFQKKEKNEEEEFDDENEEYDLFDEFQESEKSIENFIIDSDFRTMDFISSNELQKRWTDFSNSKDINSIKICKPVMAQVISCTNATASKFDAESSQFYYILGLIVGGARHKAMFIRPTKTVVIPGNKIMLGLDGVLILGPNGIILLSDDSVWKCLGGTVADLYDSWLARTHIKNNDPREKRNPDLISKIPTAPQFVDFQSIKKLPSTATSTVRAAEVLQETKAGSMGKRIGTVDVSDSSRCTNKINELAVFPMDLFFDLDALELSCSLAERGRRGRGRGNNKKLPDGFKGSAQDTHFYLDQEYKEYIEERSEIEQRGKRRARGNGRIKVHEERSLSSPGADNKNKNKNIFPAVNNTFSFPSFDDFESSSRVIQDGSGFWNNNNPTEINQSKNVDKDESKPVQSQSLLTSATLVKTALEQSRRPPKRVEAKSTGTTPSSPQKQKTEKIDSTNKKDGESKSTQRPKPTLEEEFPSLSR